MDNNTKESSPVAKEDKTILETSSDIINLEIQDIEDIGPTTAKKLKDAGIVSVIDRMHKLNQIQYYQL